MAELTDLEAVVIGVIRRNQPCTPYLVRKCLQASPTAHFSDSAGSIYPLIRRLENQGLLSSVNQATGERKASAYSCTRAGSQAVRNWLGALGNPQALMAMDPLRTRIAFLDFLPQARRQAWLAQARVSLEAQLELISVFQKEDGAASGKFLDLANDNAKRLTRERIRWIDDCANALDDI